MDARGDILKFQAEDIEYILKQYLAAYMFISKNKLPTKIVIPIPAKFQDVSIEIVGGAADAATNRQLRARKDRKADEAVDSSSQE